VDVKCTIDEFLEFKVRSTMDEFLSIFTSPVAVAFAWICTVVSCMYGLSQKNAVIKIKKEVTSLNVTNSVLLVKNTKLEQKITKIETTDVSGNSQKIEQKGKNNINQQLVKGDVNIEL
jgi:cell division protein FtsB